MIKLYGWFKSYTDKSVEVSSHMGPTGTSCSRTPEPGKTQLKSVRKLVVLIKHSFNMFIDIRRTTNQKTMPDIFFLNEN